MYPKHLNPKNLLREYSINTIITLKKRKTTSHSSITLLLLKRGLPEPKQYTVLKVLPIAMQPMGIKPFPPAKTTLLCWNINCRNIVRIAEQILVKFGFSLEAK